MIALVDRRSGSPPPIIRGYTKSLDNVGLHNRGTFLLDNRMPPTVGLQILDMYRSGKPYTQVEH